MFKNQEELLNRIDKNQVVALIPARGGSKGVPKKNIRLIKDYPLIAYTIAAGKMSESINRVIVSTDSKEIGQLAVQFGAEVPFIRPKELAEDDSGDIGFVKHAIHYFDKKEGVIPEYLVHLRPTTPFRDSNIIDTAIQYCIDHTECCSLRSGHIASESPYKWFLKDSDGYFRSVKDGLDNEEANNGRQKFPDVYVPDGYVDVLKSSYVINHNKLHGSKMLAFESPNCTEIDTFDDLDYVRYQIEKKGLALYQYLRNKF